MKPMLTFGEWLEDQYLRAGFTQMEFAEAVGVAQSTVSSWVNVGKKPRRRVVPAIARALNLSEDEVLERIAYPRRSAVDEPGDEGAVGEIDLDDPFLTFWASYSGELDPHDKEILQELARSLAQKRRADQGGTDR
jgi:transcriptional regulator with XRE-family HTH domain